MSNAKPSILGRRCALVAIAVACVARPVQAQCVYNLSTTNVSVPSTANTGSLSVVAGTSCGWTASSNASWITVTGGVSGFGIGTVTYSVAVNTTGAARSGTLTVAGKTVTINQAAASCTYSVSTTTVSVPSTASSGSLSVTTGTSCSWTAISNVSWITVTGGVSGFGIGTVTYSVAVNTTGAARSGTLTVAGKTVTINQVAGSPPLAPPKNLRVIRH